MTQVTEALVRQALARVLDPHNGSDIVSGGALRAVGIDGARVSVDVQLSYPAAGWQTALAAQIEQVLTTLPEIEAAVATVSYRVYAHQVQKELSPLPGVRNIVAVASGKGGVGKSTTAVNLALALQAEGAQVGVLDADVYGPSLPLLTGTSGKPDSPDGQNFNPKRNHGLQLMSIGYMIDEDTPVIWRGPMVTQALMQLATNTLWQDLDYLIIDFPPGTGDIALTLAQRIPMSAAIIVTTPQDVALIDAKKALKMFEKVEVPVLGIVENMSTHICSHCGHEEAIFGAGGGERMAQQYGRPLLGSLPLDIRIRSESDAGTPIVMAQPQSELTARYRLMARNVAARLSLQARNKAIQFPKIVIQNT
ncbi:ATP-binding protein involved in chromosome partitioning [Tahibacter aquaticus]|uniref:Iron-sulfur cluster carrier protein n=1 Tax=Tahibacter aquaticus TaxID=520092 RepID=A0A4R6YYW3_9GAMM|nr:iron-sulfur cluster carrier protein ApbC [Tahibacter aquaticus]TDR44078.1 ATP-binding protein involved in chromosome partitioning [Tahibacter aquaticus]